MNEGDRDNDTSAELFHHHEDRSFKSDIGKLCQQDRNKHSNGACHQHDENRANAKGYVVIAHLDAAGKRFRGTAFALARGGAVPDVSVSRSVADFHRSERLLDPSVEMAFCCSRGLFLFMVFSMAIIMLIAMIFFMAFTMLIAMVFFMAIIMLIAMV